MTLPEFRDPYIHQEGDGGDNLLVGAVVRDHLTGLGGDDTLVGNEGTDYLVGGGDDDTLTGGYSDPDSGPETDLDMFAFGRIDGRDTITDFNATGPTPDLIILLDGTSNDRDMLIDSMTATQGGDAVLHYGETTITLIGVSTVAVLPEMILTE